MLVRRERKYTLFFRLVRPAIDIKEVKKIKSWNAKVEKAVAGVAESAVEGRRIDDASSDGSSTVSGGTASTGASSKSRKTSLLARGRSMFPTAGRVRGRRATPTPSARKHLQKTSSGTDGTDSAADGFSLLNPGAPSQNGAGGLTQSNLMAHQRSISGSSIGSGFMKSGGNGTANTVSPSDSSSSVSSSNGVEPVPLAFQPSPVMEPKDELVDVIRGLRNEKQQKLDPNRIDPSELRPNWQPKAEVPPSVPKLPTEYIHRHRLMKQAVNCLLDQVTDTASDKNRGTIITSVTSRHADKAGNGKTTLAAAAIQTVEVRERFCDGIIWIQLGRHPLNEKDIRAFYEEIHRQLMCLGGSASDGYDDDDALSDLQCNNGRSSPQGSSSGSDTSSGDSKERINDTNTSVEDGIPPNDNKSSSHLGRSRRRFQSGELEGMREDLSKIMCHKKVLLCIDDVWRAEDACWFMFNCNNNPNESGQMARKRLMESPFRILITTRFPELLGPGVAKEVFVRIFSEHEAIKLLLSSAGKRPFGGKNSKVFSEARVVVKGCGNSPLAVRLAGGMLRKTRHWTMSSPTWIALVEQCKKSLMEATQIRSFSKAVGRIVDLSFSTVEDATERAALRRCFVTFAVVFSNSKLIRVNKGIPKDVILALFSVVQGGAHSNESSSNLSDPSNKITPSLLLETFETMNLLERARPAVKPKDLASAESSNDKSNDLLPEEIEKRDMVFNHHGRNSTEQNTSYLMHASVRAIAEEMSTRLTPSFAPPDASPEEPASAWSTPFRSAAKYLVQIGMKFDQDASVTENQFHDLMAASLTGGWWSSSRSSICSVLERRDQVGPEMEFYIAAYLPSHLIRAKALSSAGELLVDSKFVLRRVSAMGPIESTRQQVADFIELRRAQPKGDSSQQDTTTNEYNGDSSDITSLRSGRSLTSPKHAIGYETQLQFDISSILCDGSRRMIDEVYRADTGNVSSSSSLSFSMAICLSIIGEGLLKCRQPREAMLRLEEAVGIYRGLLGRFNTDVARSLSCVGHAYVKMGESRVALLKFGEAARIYVECNATNHFDALANAQTMAALLVDLGDFSNAEAKYEDVIQIRRAVNGNLSPSVARTLNDYAVVLAKHGKAQDAIRYYEEARSVFENAAASDLPFNFVETGGQNGFIFDAALIEMNIAAIKAKKGDLSGAICSYEEGERKLRQLEKGLVKGSNNAAEKDGKSKHLISAIGKIGSLKLKQNDRQGAMAAFERVLEEASGFTSSSILKEKAKAHIKCATIIRQIPENQTVNQHLSVQHLQDALQLYTKLYGSSHRDTQTVASSLRQWQQDALTLNERHPVEDLIGDTAEPERWE